MAYSPPPGSFVAFSFTASGYSPPPGSLVTLELIPAVALTLFVGGFETLALDAPSIRNNWTFAAPSGIDGGGFGTPTVWNYKTFTYPPSIVPALYDQYGRVVDGFGTATTLWLNFSGTYTPPAGGTLVFEFVPAAPLYMRPYGIFDFAMGTPAVSLFIRSVFPYGAEQTVFGAATIYNSQLTAQVVPGRFDEDFGVPAVRNTRRFVGVDHGIDSLTFALAKVANAIGPPQSVLPHDFGALTTAGVPSVTYWLQYVLVHNPGAAGQFGAARVSLGTRTVYPSGLAFALFGQAKVDFAPKLRPFGFDRSAFGTPHLTFGNVLQPEGFDAAALGAPLVRSMRTVVYPRAVEESGLFGSALVYNSRQYALVNSQVFDYAPYMGPYTDVRNRNRRIDAYGIDPPRISNVHRAIMTGQQTLPGMGATDEFGVPLVAFRVRYIYQDNTSFFAGYFDPYHFVHNYAIRVQLTGFDSLQMPTTHLVWFNAQHAAPRVPNLTAYGTPFVAFNPRYLLQYSPDFGQGFAAGTPWVSFAVRTLVEEPWDPPYAFGTPLVISHRNQATAFPISYNDYGTPHVRNVTPELSGSGGDESEFGDARVSHSPRYVQPGGVSPPDPGRTIVLFRTRKLFVGGFTQWAVGQPSVLREGADPPSTQIVAPDSFGQVLPGSFFGRPAVQSSPYPEGWDSQEFGNTWVRVQGCRPYWPHPDSTFQFGIPSLNATQTVVQKNPDGEVGAQTGWPPKFSYHRVGPHTIWARFDTPAQAIENNPQSNPWDGIDNDRLLGFPPWFGKATVTIPGLQTVKQLHLLGVDEMSGGWIGEHAIDSNKHRIYPVGLSATHFGTPKLQPRLQKVWPTMFESSEFGATLVGLQPFFDLHLRPLGISSLAMVGQFIENLNRPLYPAGFTATLFGNNLPMVYHYPRGPNPVGNITFTEFGPDTWVSYRVRGLQLEGFESFEEGYTPGQFDQRLRVSGRHPGGPPTYSVGDALHLGIPQVTYGGGATQYIRPYMIPPPIYCHPHSITEG